MTKLELIKTKLAKILFQFETIKTDKGVLEYDGELKVDTKVYVTDENGERKDVEDGNYITEDETTIVVANGVVVEIIEKQEELPTEETTEEVTEELTEEVVEEVTEEPTEEVTEEVVEDGIEKEIESLKYQLEELKNKLEDFAVLIRTMVEKNEKDANNIETRLSKIENMSASKPIEQEVEITKKRSNTGDSKVDNFIKKYC
jgi:hypothetical protein